MGTVSEAGQSDPPAADSGASTIPHTGVEEKPRWLSVPEPVKQAIATALGSPVVRAMRAWGSYGPGPSYRVRLADGRRAFIKALWPESNDFQRNAFANELRAYDDLYHLIRPWAPEKLGVVEVSDWHVLLLEDVGPKTAPPWTRNAAQIVARGLAEFHSATAAGELPGWVPRLTQMGIVNNLVWATESAIRFHILPVFHGKNQRPTNGLTVTEKFFCRRPKACKHQRGDNSSCISMCVQTISASTMVG